MSSKNQDLNQTTIAKVALGIPSSDPYDYSVPAELNDTISIGCRVLVSLRSRYLLGWVTDVTDFSSVSGIKPIITVVDENPLYNQQMMSLSRWMSSYYLCSYGEVLDSSLPAILKPKISLLLHVDWEKAWKYGISEQEVKWLKQAEGKNAKTAQKFKSSDSSKQLAKFKKNGVVSFSPQLTSRSLIETEEVYLSLGAQHSQGGYKPRKGSKAALLIARLEEMSRVRLSNVKSDIKGINPVIKTLEEKGVVCREIEKVGNHSPVKEIHDEKFISLNDDQKSVYSRIQSSIESDSFQTFLLHGVTGSGKTEVYLCAVRDTLKRGKSALILIPEISLTPQAVSRFRERFGERIAVLHSGLTDTQRGIEWWKIKNGDCDIVVGARSAIFAPLESIGLIVVDEEHDTSYKQQETPYYNARDVAIKIASDRKAVVILGSATPSIESYYNSCSGKYSLLELTQRANQKPLPEPWIVSLKDEPRQQGAFYLSKVLIENIKLQLEIGKQVLIFLNRRGFAAFLSCKSCEMPVLCNNCSIAMTWHKTKRRLICHHCGFTSGYPNRCDSCDSQSFRMEGIGTQRIEQDLKALLPDTRFLRMDRDSISKKGSLEKHIDAINQQEVDVIIGTQLISKGHDFKNIGLVCIVLADMSLNIPDFRSSERSFQLMSQVSGRAGRDEEGKGLTLIQTYNPEHYAVQCAVTSDYKAFYQREIEEREILLNPPKLRMILLKISSTNSNSAQQTAKELTSLIRSNESELAFSVLGPIESPLQKINNRFYWQVLIKGVSLNKVKAVLKRLLWNQKRDWLKGSTRVTVDVDPYMML